MFLTQFAQRRHLFLVSGFFLLLLLVVVSALRQDPHTAVAAPQETPTTMVAEDVTSYTLAHPRLIWRTASQCDELPSLLNQVSDTAVPEDPELISRLFVTGGNSRVIWSKNDPRPPGSCNPYKFLSNVVGDGNYVYWADESGLVRQSVEANAQDEPEVVSTAVKSTHNGNKVLLALSDDHIYALIYPTPISAQILRFSKSTLTADPAYSILGYGTQLAADEDGVYWLFSGSLWRATYEQGTGWDAASIATGVTSFASSDFYLYIARGNNIVRYNKVDGSTTTPLYTSSSPNAPNIYNVVHSQSATGELFFLESRESKACPDCFIEYTQVLFRMGPNGGPFVPLYTKASPLIINVFNLQAADGYVYWQEDDTIQRLTQNADALPQTNITIERIEVTQGTQDINNNVPLIGGRRTFVRVFGLSAGADVPNVTAYLYRVNPATLEPIGDPLVPMNSQGGTHNVVHPVHVPLLLDNSFVYELPLSWVQTGQPLRLKAVVNPFNN
ncbi:MAG: hypothetical protein KDD89_04730, partial [Anaerolineales bacterium]|nr:hypothetical protein [Anaerolineales bacterium]